MDAFVWGDKGRSTGSDWDASHSDVKMSLSQVEQLVCFISHSLTVVSQRGHSYKGKDGKESVRCAILHRIMNLATRENLGLIVDQHGHATESHHH